MKRIVELQRRLQARDIDLALIMQPRDLYYYTGTAQPCNLLVPAESEALLFVRRAWDFVERETHLPASQIRRATGMSEIFRTVQTLGLPRRRIAVTEDAIPASIFRKITATFAGSECVDLTPLVLEQRMIKDPSELALLRKSADLFSFAHLAVLESLHPGVAEVEIAADVLKAIRAHGGESIVRHRRWDASLPPEGLVVSTTNMWHISGHAMTITGVGLNNALPWGASWKRVREGDLLILDMGLNIAGYHADIARTYVLGEANQRQRNVFHQVYAIQQAALDKIKNGVPAVEVYLAAAHKAKELNCGDFFQGFEDMQGSYIGHGLGLEIDEPPTLDKNTKLLLQAGMVLAIEPKLIIPGFGGIVLEDDVVVTQDGYDLITPVERKLYEVPASD